MPHQLQLKTVNIVALGVFDVRCFTPTALLRNDVLTVPEATATDALAAIPGQVVTYQSGTLKMSAEQQRIQIDCLAPPYIRAADILSKTLRDNATSPSKIAAVGINTHATWVMEDYETRDRLGRRLAPIDAWGGWSEELKRAAQFGPRDPRHPGMVSVTMRLPMSDDRKAGWIDVKVGGTGRPNVPEILITINDHYALPSDEHDADPLALLATVETRFDSSMKRADEIMASILGQVK